MAAPSTILPEWATDATFPAGSSPWSGQPPRVTTGLAALASTGHIPDTQTDAETFNAWLGILSEWITFFRAELGVAWYGDASDGNATITGGTTTLTRDMYYDSLVVESTGVLAANGFRIWARSLQVDAGGVVSADGSPGVDGDSGGTGGAGAPGGSVGAGVAGGAGGSNADGTAGGNVSDAIGGNGGVGGDEGPLDPARTPGAGGTATDPAAVDGGWRHLHAAFGRQTGGATDPFNGGAGGGGGAGGQTEQGGGGGGGGGILCVFAHTAVINGTIRANGGDGGMGGEAGDGDGSGGGGGGGGGAVYLVTRIQSGSGTIEAAGGVGGDRGENGTAGANGSAGVVFQFTA